MQLIVRTSTVSAPHAMIHTEYPVPLVQTEITAYRFSKEPGSPHHTVKTKLTDWFSVAAAPNSPVLVVVEQFPVTTLTRTPSCEHRHHSTVALQQQQQRAT
jgi:hypothetical protein